MTDWLKLRKLFTSTFCISAFTVGGGAVIVPLLQRKFVEDLGWIEEQEMLDMVAIAQASPGVMAVNVSIMIGYRVAGAVGALLTVLATVLPPLLIMSVIAMGYRNFQENRLVRLFLSGMQAAVGAFLVNMVYKMVKIVFKQKEVLPLVLLFAAVPVALWGQFNVVLVILACGLAGVGQVLFKKYKLKKENR